MRGYHPNFDLSPSTVKQSEPVIDRAQRRDPEFPEVKNPPKCRRARPQLPIPLLLPSSSLLSPAIPPPPASHAHASNLYPSSRPPGYRLACDAEARPRIINRTPGDVRVVHGALRQLFPVRGGPLRGPARIE